MENNLLTGQLVQLTAINTQEYPKLLSGWLQDSEFLRLMDPGPAMRFSAKGIKKWVEERLENDAKTNPPRNIGFEIHALENGQLIGDIGLDGINYLHGESYVGIAIGERAYWGKGYGTDAMRVILRYAFQELNLHRVSLAVFSYNTRGIRSYEKVGFKHEGRSRQVLSRDGQRYDVINMGILHSEWEALYA